MMASFQFYRSQSIQIIQIRMNLFIIIIIVIIIIVIIIVIVCDIVCDHIIHCCKENRTPGGGIMI